MKRELLEQYAAGVAKLRRAMAGLTPDEMMAVPIPGKWSTHVVVIHLADAEAAFADRIRRIIAMENPRLEGWDENEFLRQGHYEKQSADDAVAMIEITRRQLMRVLSVLPDEAFHRTGVHSERGPQTVEDVINYAVTHLDHHLKFVAQKREKLGKPF